MGRFLLVAHNQSRIPINTDPVAVHGLQADHSGILRGPNYQRSSVETSSLQPESLVIGGEDHVAVCSSVELFRARLQRDKDE